MQPARRRRVSERRGLAQCELEVPAGFALAHAAACGSLLTTAKARFCALRQAVPGGVADWVGQRCALTPLWPVARGPEPSPGTNSPQDCLCPGSVHRPGVAPQNSLRALRPLRSNNRGEHDHEARCARRPRTCAPRRPTQRPHRVPPAARDGLLRPTKKATGGRKGAFGQDMARLCGAEERRACGLARSANRHQTRRDCSSAAAAGRVASFATGRKTEHHRAVGAQRRPLQ